MMVEEAIRNGTWVPAMGGLYGGVFFFVSFWGFVYGCGDWRREEERGKSYLLRGRAERRAKRAKGMGKVALSCISVISLLLLGSRNYFAPPLPRLLRNLFRTPMLTSSPSFARPTEPGVPPGARGRGVVDLSKKPVLWEAWLGGGGRGLGGDRKEKDTNVNGAADVDIDWDMIKPFSVAYLSAPSRSSVNGSSTPLPTNGSRTALPHETSAASTDASGSTAVVTPPLSNPSGSGGQIISSSTPAPAPASSSSTPQTQTPTPARSQPRRRRSRAFLGWLSNAIDPNGAPTSPLPEREREHDGTHREGEGDARLEMDEMDAKGGAQDGPKMVRVAVMIAMPRAPTVVSGSGSGSVRNSSIPSGMGSHPLQEASMSDPAGSGSGGKEEEEERLPHLEMGIADVLLIPSDFEEGKDGEVDGKRRSGWTETEGGHG